MVRIASHEHGGLFDGRNASLSIVSTDPDDERLGRLKPSSGVRCIWDFDQAVSRLYGAVDDDGGCRRCWLVLDPMLRVLRVAPLENAHSVMAFVAALPPCALHAGAALPAPVLVVPRVLEPGLCRHLIGLYRADGGEESGFMLETEGRTVLIASPDGLDQRNSRADRGEFPPDSGCAMSNKRRSCCFHCSPSSQVEAPLAAHDSAR